jgi:hypothetical protein
MWPLAYKAGIVKVRTRDKKCRIRDKHPGSATLVKSLIVESLISNHETSIIFIGASFTGLKKSEKRHIN